MGKGVCFFCGMTIPLNSDKKFVSHNVMRPEGLTTCEGSLRRMEK